MLEHWEREAAYPVWLTGIKKVLGADGACGDVAAGVLLELGEMHAGVAMHAVASIHAQAPPPPAQVAEGAVVNAASHFIVPKPADSAIVLSHPCPAVAAFRCKTQVLSSLILLF